MMRFEKTPSSVVSTLAALAVAALWIWLRLYVFADILVPLTYVVPLMLCIWTRKYWQLWGLAALFAVAATVELWYILPEDALPARAQWTAFGATLLNIGMGTLIVGAIMRLRTRLEHQAQVLADQNTEITAQAEELAQQNEEISQQTEELNRQNEQMQSQAEELERQNEELLHLNEDLHRREDLLQGMLEMARRPMAGDRSLNALCAGMLKSIGSPAISVTILERQGDDLVVSGTAGPRDAGSLQSVWPYAGSLAELVIQERRTACVDDLEARGDLSVPCYRGTQAKSALASPIFSRSSAVGAVVVCGVEAVRWSSEQFHVVEWISGQCSLILEALQWQDELREVALLPQQNPDAVIRVLTGGTVIYANPAGIRLLQERGSGIDHAAPSEIWEPAQEVLGTGTVVDREVSVGGRMYSVRYVPVADCEYVNVYAHDITVKYELQDRIRRAVDRYALLAESASELLKSADAQAVVERLCRKVMKYLGCDVFFNFIHDPETHRLHLNAYGGISAEDAQKITWLDLGSAICGCAARDRERIVAEDIQHSADERASLVRSYGVQAYCSCPLLVGQEAIGTLSFGTRQRTRFSTEEVELIQAVTDQVAVAMHRIRTEQELQVSERRFRATFEQAATGIAHVSLNGQWLRVNDRYCQIVGYPREELLKLTFQQITHPEDLPLDLAMAQRLVAGDIPSYSMEKRYIRKDGTLVWVELTGSVVRDEHGNPVHFIAAAVDISARKAAQEALNRNNLLLNAISASTGDVIYAKDLQGRLTYANPATLELVGKPMEQVLGHTDLEFLNDKEAARQVMANDRRIMDSGIAEDVEEYIPMPDGRRVIWLSRKAPYRDGEGNVIGLLGVSRDITARKDFEAQQQELSRQRQLALDAAQLGWWQYDPLTQMASYDRRYCEIFDVTGSERPNDEILKRLHPDDLPAVWKRVQAALDPVNPEPYFVEYRIFRGDGSIRWVEAHGLALFEGEGDQKHAVSFVGTVEDVTDYKLASEAVRLSEQRYRSFVEATSHVVWTTDHQGQVRFDIPAWQAYTGQTGTQAAGFGWMDAVHPDDRAGVAAAWAEASAAGGIYEVEYRLRRQDGSWRDILARGVPVKDAQGRVLEYVGTCMDITERKSAEAALRENETKLRTFVDSDITGILFGDLDGRIYDCNQELARIIGRPRQDVLDGKVNWTDITPPEDLPLDEKAAAQAKANGRCTPYEKHYLRPDGTRVPILVGYVLLEPERHKSVAFILDISERKAAEAAMKKSQELADFLSRTLQQSSQPFAAGYPDGRLMVFNEAYVQLTGYSEQELRSSSWADQLTPPEWREHETKVLETLHRTGEPQLYEKEYLRKDGARVSIEIKVHLVRDTHGQPAYYYAFLTDITQRKLTEQALREAKDAAEAANRAKDQFLATLSHELRTPLTPVLTIATLMENDSRLLPEHREDAAMIRRNVTLETRLIDDLLDLTRISRGKLQLQFAPLDLCDLLEHTAGICSGDADAKGISLVLDTKEIDGATVDGDSARLQQVFWNVLKNAIKFTPSGGRITVRGSIAQGEGESFGVAVDVIDTGKGIEPEMLPRLFRPFEQGSASITKQFGGLGLGLAICRSLVELHGGLIEARSEGLGRGSTFRVILPLSDAVPLTARPKPVASPALVASKLRILLVEDHEDTAKLMTRVLKMSGHTVHRAGDVATGIEISEQIRFDLVLSDLGLPDGSGLDLIRTLRKSGVSFRAIALSGFGTEDDVRRSLDAGFDVHLTKPVSLEVLSETIRRVMSVPAGTKV